MKLQVTVSDELVARIDKYAKMMGISRSALCAVWIGQSVMTYDKSYELLDKCGMGVVDALNADIQADKAKKAESTSETLASVPVLSGDDLELLKDGRLEYVDV